LWSSHCVSLPAHPQHHFATRQATVTSSLVFLKYILFLQHFVLFNQFTPTFLVFFTVGFAKEMLILFIYFLFQFLCCIPLKC
jgi:hypothetical protein